MKYKIKKYTNLFGCIRYGVYKQFLFLWWIKKEQYMDKSEAIYRCKELSQSIK